MKMGPATRSRIVVFVMAKSSRSAPSSDSSAYPQQPSKTQLEIVTLMKPPFDSVPHLMRPVRGTRNSGANFLKVPSRTAPVRKTRYEAVGDGDISRGPRIA